MIISPKHLLIFIFILFTFTNCISASKQFWDIQRGGANIFNAKISDDTIFHNANKFGLSFVRLAPNKWIINDETLGDFLIGSKDNPNIEPNQQDVDYLIKILDYAFENDIKVVLTMISLPYYRWRQHNNGIQERTLFSSFEAQNIAIKFWQNLVKQLKDHPAIVGYNILNEPSSEKINNQNISSLSDWYNLNNYINWYKNIENTPADLNLFYNKIVKAIREIDKDTPIILDSGYYATPYGFSILKPINDPNVLYSFHMYEPYSFTSYKENGKYIYPGNIPIGELGKTIELINKNKLEKLMLPVIEFQKKYNIPSNRIIVGEFGTKRYTNDSKTYLHDLIKIFNKYKWHWAFYSFQEDEWDAMNYQLGRDEKKGKTIWWKAFSSKTSIDYTKISDKALEDIIKLSLPKNHDCIK